MAENAAERNSGEKRNRQLFSTLCRHYNAMTIQQKVLISLLREVLQRQSLKPFKLVLKELQEMLSEKSPELAKMGFKGDRLRRYMEPNSKALADFIHKTDVYREWNKKLKGSYKMIPLYIAFIPAFLREVSARRRQGFAYSSEKQKCAGFDDHDTCRYRS